VCAFALGCGGNTQMGEPSPQPTLPGASGALNGAGNGGATAMPTKPVPTGGAAGAATTSPGGTETSGGDSTGQGGAEPTDACAGIVPRCLPGEPVCDPMRGKLTTCSDCGESLPGGEAACARIIASDKESNGVCVVHSSDQLGCWSGWGQGQKNVVPTDVVELLIQDDFAEAEEPPNPCVRRRSGEYSCFGGGADMVSVAVGDYGVCGVHRKVGLYCEESVNAPAVLVPSPVDVAITDGSAFVLGPSGVATENLPTRLPTFWKGAPARLRVDHQSAGCIISDLGELACWIDLREALRPSPWLGKYRKLVPATMPRACVLDDERQLRCGDVFADSEPAPLGSSDTIDFAASASNVCALSVAGRVSCWNRDGEPLELPEGW
jgi:hypothetical protein